MFASKLNGCPKFLVRIHVKKDLTVISREEENIVTGDYLEIFITFFPILKPLNPNLNPRP